MHRKPPHKFLHHSPGKKVSLHQSSAMAAPGAPHAVTSFAAHPVSVRAAARGCSRIHPLPVVCPPPAGGRQLCLIILPPLTLRQNAKVDPAGSGPAACRPSPVPHCRPHGGGGGGRISSVPPETCRPQIQKPFLTIKIYSYVLHQDVCRLLGDP